MLYFSVHIVCLKDLFAASSPIIIFVLSVKKYAIRQVLNTMKKMLRKMFSAFEAEALNNNWMRNYKYNFI